jgi:DNA invertase Pin-like site-specific DNA recombinase
VPPATSTNSKTATLRSGSSPGATAVIYLRVSSTGQLTGHTAEGYSIEGQREACQRHVDRLGAKVVAEFVELGRTGTNLRRPALQNMLAQLPRLKPDFVVFYDLSRVAREEQDAFWLLGEIRRHGAKLESTLERIDDSPQGLLLYAIMAASTLFGREATPRRSSSASSASSRREARLAKHRSATSTAANGSVAATSGWSPSTPSAHRSSRWRLRRTRPVSIR